MTPNDEPSGHGRPAADAPQEAPVPDEDGPHDVPDEAVIEATLPTVPVGRPG